MNRLLLPAIIIFCISCSSEPPYTPPKKEIKGIVTEKSDYGEIPLTGATVHVVHADSVKGIDEKILKYYNLMRHCYNKYLYFKEVNGLESAIEILEVNRDHGVYDEPTYLAAEKKAISSSAVIITNPSTKTTTVNSLGEYSITVDSGKYFVLISLPVGTNFYGSYITTTGEVNNFSKSLYNPR